MIRLENKHLNFLYEIFNIELYQAAHASQLVQNSIRNCYKIHCLLYVQLVNQVHISYINVCPTTHALVTSIKLNQVEN